MKEIDELYNGGDDVSPQRRAGSLRGRRHHQRLDEAALAVREGDLGDADVLEGAAGQVRAPRPRAPRFLLALHLAHELPHERLAHLETKRQLCSLYFFIKEQTTIHLVLSST